MEGNIFHLRLVHFFIFCNYILITRLCLGTKESKRNKIDVEDVLHLCLYYLQCYIQGKIHSPATLAHDKSVAYPLVMRLD